MPQAQTFGSSRQRQNGYEKKEEEEEEVSFEGDNQTVKARENLVSSVLSARGSRQHTCGLRKEDGEAIRCKLVRNFRRVVPNVEEVMSQTRARGNQRKVNGTGVRASEDASTILPFRSAYGHDFKGSILDDVHELRQRGQTHAHEKRGWHQQPPR